MRKKHTNSQNNIQCDNTCMLIKMKLWHGINCVEKNKKNTHNMLLCFNELQTVKKKTLFDDDDDDNDIDVIN